MPAINFALLRSGMRANLASVAGMQLSPYALSNPTPPTIQIAAGAVEYDKAFNGGAHVCNFKVYVFVGMVSDIGAQKRLDLCLGTGTTASVKDALESDVTLAGACADVHVLGASEAKTYGQGGNVLGAELDVQVLV